MKRFRIKNNYTNGYKVEERIWFLWGDCMFGAYFHTIEAAREFVERQKKSIKQHKEDLKKAKYIEYL